MQRPIEDVDNNKYQRKDKERLTGDVTEFIYLPVSEK